MWIRRSGFVYVTLISLLLALLFRIYYVSFGGIQTSVRAVAGGRSATLDLYNSKGIIYDRNMIALSGNQFCYYLVVNPRGFDRSNIDDFCSVTSCDKQELIDKLNKENIFIVKSYNSLEEMDGVYSYDGVTRYASDPVCQHVIGYLDSDEVVGLSGVEKAFDSELSSVSSKVSIKYSVNAVQGVISGLGIEPENDNISLDGVILTLDKKISSACESAMEKYIKNGAVIVMDCNNGEILSLCSTPNFDYSSISEHVKSGDSELVNNALSVQTVGSVFKIIVAACALSNGYGEFKYDCKGGISIGGRFFYCQNEKKHGEMNIDNAFALSCNSYFIALGQLLGYDKLLETAQLFGCDSKINLCKNMYSASGDLPQYEGAQGLANFSIGQGDLMLTPLEISRITAVTCNGGFLVNPNLYYGTYKDSEISDKSIYEYKSQILNSEIAERLKQMSVKCVAEGTGKAAMPSKESAGGKTASAQTGRYSDSGNEILNNYFTGFFPADDPKYVITVFAKDGKSGAETCAPVFKEICDFISENY